MRAVVIGSLALGLWSGAVAEAAAAVVCRAGYHGCVVAHRPAAVRRVYRTTVVERVVERPVVVYEPYPAPSPACGKLLCAPLTIVNTVLSPLFYRPSPSPVWPSAW